jgi:type III pantothenate kinase
MSHAADTSSLIAIDVGNSRIKFGLFEMAEIRAAQSGTLPECRRVVSFPLNEDVPSDRLTTWVAAADSTIAGAVLAGVNPGGVERVLAVWPELGWPAPATINHPGQLPLVVRVDAPERVGIDRLLNAVAANRLRDRDVPLIIVSSGTATTVDYVAADGAFEGGAILPGFDLCALALNRHTALLPLVPAAELSGPPPHAVGKNTRDAIRSGLFWGQVGAVRELIARFERLSSTQPMIVVTGGAGALLAPQLGVQVRYEEHLPLKGLAVATK